MLNLWLVSFNCYHLNIWSYWLSHKQWCLYWRKTLLSKHRRS